jgi:hypothetical protein
MEAGLGLGATIQRLREVKSAAGGGRCAMTGSAYWRQSKGFTGSLRFAVSAASGERMSLSAMSEIQFWPTERLLASFLFSLPCTVRFILLDSA